MLSAATLNKKALHANFHFNPSLKTESYMLAKYFFTNHKIGGVFRDKSARFCVLRRFI
jgi:hypothetical protein